MCKPFVLPLVLGVLSLVGTVTAENWPQWRGPFLNGSSTETNLPVRWSRTENVLWTTPLPGPSGATPVVWGDRVFVSSADADKNLLLLCVDARTGKILWSQVAASGDRSNDQGNNQASPSPVTDGKMVWSLYGTGDLLAFDFSGKKIWSRRLTDEFGKFAHMWLYGASPLLHSGRLYVPVLQRHPPKYPHALDDKPDRESFLLCLDARTGTNLFRHIRETDALDESQEAYTTPLPFKHNGREEIILIGGDYVTGHSPETGAEYWRCGGLNAKKSRNFRIVPSPVAGGGMIFACAPKREPLIAVRAGGTGLVTDTHIAWRFDEFPPDVCTPLFYLGRLFVLDGDRKMLTCLDPETGIKKWQGNLGVNEIFKASPTGADGRIYCISERGTVVVLSAGNEFNILSTIEMGEGIVRSSIVAAQGKLFVRTAKNLCCIGATQ